MISVCAGHSLLQIAEYLKNRLISDGHSFLLSEINKSFITLAHNFCFKLNIQRI